MKRIYKAFLAAITFTAVVFLSGCNLSNSYENSRLYSVGNGEAENQINNLEINWISGEIDIIYDDNAQTISFEETASGRLTENQRIHYLEKNGKLTIQYAASNTKIERNIKKDLIVTLPSDYVLSNLTINSVSSQIYTDGLHADNLEVNTTSGYFTQTKPGFYENVEINAVSTEVILCGDFSNSIEVNTVSGQTNLFISEDTGFTVLMDGLSTGFICDFDCDISRNNKYTYKDGKLKIEINAVSGKLVISDMNA